jgi:hypothetical protein
MNAKEEEKKQAEKVATDELAKQAHSEGPKAEEAAKKRGDAERKLQS